MTKSKQNRLRRRLKRKYDSEKYWARNMTNSNCGVQKRLTTTGESCDLMSETKNLIIFTNGGRGSQAQFFARTRG
jgi:predicted DsbA family dithiol-disulfide isomerase|tara:strand:- start:1394 stop:1618 length:225 start_codon:yes stop_codon:yes gene_type:complete